MQKENLMKSIWKILGIIALIAMFVCSLTGCPNPSNSDDDDDDDIPVIEEGEIGAYTSGSGAFKVTVTNLGTPKNKMWAASLMTGTTQDTLVATAMSPVDGTFTFYLPMEGLPMPNLKAPFETAGEYYVGLSDVDMDDPYNPANALLLHGLDNEPVKITFNSDSHDWTFRKADFDRAPGTPIVPPPSDPGEPHRLIVFDLASPTVKWYARLMYESLVDVVAVAELTEETENIFTFYEPKEDGTPDTEKPYNSTGNFMLGITDDISDSSKMKILYGEQPPSGTKPIKKINYKNTATVRAVDAIEFAEPTQLTVFVSDATGKDERFGKGPSNADLRWAAWLLTDINDNTSWSTGGIRTVREDGYFDFYKKGGFGPDLTAPLATTGSYYVVLQQGTVSSPYNPDFSKAKVYSENGAAKEVTFSAGNVIQTLDLEDFIAIP
jgi:hypothetical protein